jgi:divalent metal cation (Fe/Co/Zn/Cd) transporter
LRTENCQLLAAPGSLIMTTLHRQALLLSYFTIGYNVVECALALLAGYLAGSIALVGFGLDSLVESLSGGVMIWRFARHESLSPAEEEHLERRAIKFVGYTFFVLGAYVLYESLEKLILHQPPGPSLFGMFIALASIIVMPVLFYRKYQTGKALGSASLMADSKQTLACAMLSVALLIGLGLNYWFGLWQADPAIGLVIVVLLAREGYQALKEKKLCSCASCSGLPPSADH